MSFYGLLVAICALTLLITLNWNAYYINSVAKVDHLTSAYTNAEQIKAIEASLQVNGWSFNAITQNLGEISAVDGLDFHTGSGYAAVETRTLPRSTLIIEEH